MICLATMSSAAEESLWQYNMYNNGDGEKGFRLEFFPDAFEERIPSSTPLLDLGVKVELPSCQNPGLALNIHHVVASISELETYAIGQAKAALQAAPLLGIEAIWPELATILKHLNNMSWKKKDLEIMSCEQIMREVQQSGLLPKRQAYFQCVQSGVTNGKSRDSAELDCSGSLGKVVNFINGQESTNINLISETIDFLKDKEFKGLPPNNRLEELRDVLGEITTYGSGGKEIQAGIPFDQYINQVKYGIEISIEALVDLCISKFDTSSMKPRCDLVQSEIDLYQNDLEVVFYDKAGTPPFINREMVEAIARFDEGSRENYIDYYAEELALLKAKILVKDFDWIISHMTQVAGGKDHEDDYLKKRGELVEKVEKVEMRNERRARLLRLQNNIILASEAAVNRKIAEEASKSPGATTRQRINLPE